MLDFMDSVAELERKSTASQFVSSFGFDGGRVPHKLWDLRMGDEKGFKIVPMIYTTIDRLAKSVSSVPWIVKERQAGRWSTKDDQSLTQVIEYPNDHQTRKFQMYVLTTHLLLAGNALLKRIFADESELWPLNPDRTDPLPSKEQWLRGYEIRTASGALEEILDPEQVIHFMIPDPTNLHWGMSPVSVLLETMETDREAIRWQRNTFKNLGTPPFAIMDPDVIDEDTYNRARQEIDNWLVGSQNARRPLLLPLGRKIEKLSQSASEMDFTDSRKKLGSEMASVIGFLSSMFSEEAQTYNNLLTAIRYMWENAAIPLLDVFKDSYNLAFVPKEQRRDIEITYDLSSVAALKSDLNERLSAFEKAVRNGVPVNMAVTLTDLPLEEIEDGDRAMIDARLVPMKDILGIIDRDRDTE